MVLLMLAIIGSLGKNGDTAAVEFIDVRNVRFTNTMNGARIKTWEAKRNPYFFSVNLWL